MTWKIVDISNPGTSVKFGSDDMDKISKMFSGQLNIDSVDMNSEWRFRDSKFKLRDSDNTHDYTFRTGNLTSSREISIPVILANDTMCLAGVNNNFITQQNIRDDLNTDVLYLYRGINTNGTQNQLNFDMHDSASNRDTFVDLNAEIVDNTSGSEDGRFDVRVMASGNKHQMFRVEGDMIRFGDTNLYGQFATTGLTALRTYTFPDLTTKLAGIDVDNNFNEGQTITNDSTTMLNLRRDTSSNGSGMEISTQAKDSVGNYTTYGKFRTEIFDSTDGSEDGRLEFLIVKGGSLTQTATFREDGDFEFGPNLRVLLSESGLTAQRTYTFPDKTDQVMTKTTSLANYYENNKSGANLVRTGRYEANGSDTEATGYVGASFTAIGTGSNSRSTTEGMARSFATGAVANNNAGLRMGTTRFRREWGAYAIGRIVLSSTSDIRLFFGFSSDTAEIAGETTLNNFSGVGIGKRTGDTNLFTMRNDGDATEDRVDTTIAASTNAVTLEINLNSTNFQSAINGVAQTVQTTELPAAATDLAFHCEIETGAGAADKTITIYPIWFFCGF